MAIRTFRCGSSSAVYYAPPTPRPKGNRHDHQADGQGAVYYAPPTPRPTPAGKPRPVPRADAEPVRLRTRMHLAGVRPAVHGFRVLARLPDGDSALVCLGASREEVVASARAKLAGLARHAVSIHVQQWVGRFGSGRWESLRPR
ncbi:MAG TPA: hypothetical protein VFW33_05495, partial [Gemmataceae bacterium]|nr:hypothetical protein [Gemmataceae bacterium]